MGATQTKSSEKRLLLQAFRDAFEQFEKETSRLHALESSDPRRTEDALLCVEQARLAYNDARDALAASLMTPAERTKFLRLSPSTANGHERVKDVAELFWELAGKPQGSAEDDWYRAERLLRHAGVMAAQQCYAR